MSSIFQRIKRGLRKRHPDIYEATKNYAKEQGVRVDDVLGAAVSSYLSTTDEGKEALEDAIEARAESGGGGGTGMKGIEQALSMFERMSKATVDMMTTAQKAGQDLIRGSLLNEIKNQAQTIEEIKQIGASGGKGGIEDVLATALVNKMLQGAGVSIVKKEKGTTKKSGEGKVDKIEEPA